MSRRRRRWTLLLKLPGLPKQRGEHLIARTLAMWPLTKLFGSNGAVWSGGGHPETLVLQRLKSNMPEARDPVQVPFERLSGCLGKKMVDEQEALPPKSYKSHVPGALHDNVTHCKKQVKVSGKWRWQKPNYVKVVTHKVAGEKRSIRCKAGTEVIDRAWGFLKDRAQINQNCRVGSSTMQATVFPLLKHRAPSSYCAGKHPRIVQANSVSFEPLFTATATCSCWNLPRFIHILRSNHMIYLWSCMYHIFWTDTGLQKASCFNCWITGAKIAYTSLLRS